MNTVGEDSEASLVSALADGELRGDEFRSALDRLGESDSAMSEWRVYHVVGETLRGELVGIRPGASNLMTRLRAQLDAPAANALRLAAPASGIARQGLERRPAQPANDSRRWRWAALVASLVAVATIGWHVLSLDHAFGGGPQWAATGAAPEPPSAMLRDPRLDALLAAHRELGGASALQMPSGFLRNATFGHLDRGSDRP